MKISDELGFRILRRLRPPQRMRGEQKETKGASYVPKLKSIVGQSGWEELRGKSILDFGCGVGSGAIEMAQHGARRVIGLDIRSEVLETAKDAAEKAGLRELCQFVQALDEPVDIIVSVDAFEHFGDPGEILSIMASLLKDDGKILVSFGPTWYHPRGGHGFSIFPWSHLLFSERAQMRWRSDFRDDGATRFSEISGGLNQMTIKRFLKLVAQSPLRIESFRTVPIRPLKWAHNRFTREFTTSIVECVLAKAGKANSPSPDRDDSPMPAARAAGGASS